MTRTLYGAAILAVALPCCGAALARGSIPVIRGNYVSTTRVYCQPVINIFHSNGAVNLMTLTQNLPTTYSTATEFYDPTTGMVTISGVSEAGSSLLLDDDQNNVMGNPFRESSPAPLTVPFSNTLSTVTINSVQYHVEWGLRKKNVAQYFVLLQLDTNGCVTQSEKTRR